MYKKKCFNLFFCHLKNLIKTKIKVAIKKILFLLFETSSPLPLLALLPPVHHLQLELYLL